MNESFIQDIINDNQNNIMCHGDSETDLIFKQQKNIANDTKRSALNI